MTTDGQPVRAYRIRVEVFAPGGDEPMNQAAVSVPIERVRETSKNGLAMFFAGFFDAIEGDVVEIIRDHADGEGVR